MRAGDNLTLVAPRGAVTPMGTTPRIKAYKIAAVFEIGMSEYDSAFVFMPLTEAQAYFNRAGDVTAIEVYTDDPDHIDRFRKLGHRRRRHGRSTWSTGASATPRSSMRCRSSAM